ncbi:MAG: sulfite exporter TauE/SafE family protein [Anaerolineae bacterium]
MSFLGYGVDFWLIALIAVGLTGLSKAGFGGGVGAIATPLMALIMPVPEAAALLLPILILADQAAVYKYKNRVDLKTMWVSLPGAIIGIAIAWFAFDQLQSAENERVLKIGIGVVSIVFLVFQLSRDYIFKRIDGVRFPDWVGFSLGTIAGFTSTLAHVGGPPFQIYVIPQKLKRDIFVGTSAWFFWAVNLLKLVAYGFLGLLTIGNLTVTVILLPFVVIGVYLGFWLNGRVRQEVFNWIIYILLGVTAVQLILGQSLLGLTFG